MALKMLLIALVASLVLAMNSANAALINIQNFCGETITACAQSKSDPVFPYVLSAGGGFQQLDVSDNWPSAAVWAFPGSSGSAATCTQARPEADLAEINIQPPADDFYDISNVNAYNLPLAISLDFIAQGDKPSPLHCETVSCTIPNLSSFCQSPNALTGPPGDACKNVDGPNSPTPTPSTEPFKNACPNAFSYTDDFKNTGFTCATGSNYGVTFCPSNAVGAKILHMVSEATS